MQGKDVSPKAATNVTDEVIEAWKKSNPTGVFQLSVSDKKCWIRKPNRNELKMISAKAKTSDPITITEMMLEILWLGGDEEMKTNDDLFFSIMPRVQEVMDVEEGSLKKL